MSIQAFQQLGVVHALELGAVHGAVTVAGDAEFARNGQAGELVVAGDHDRPDAGRAALGDGHLDLLARRVDLADQPEQRCAAGQGVEAGGRIERVVGHRGDGEHAQRPAGHALGGLAGCVQRRLPIGHAQAQHRFRRALDEHSPRRLRDRVARGHHLGVGVERQLGLARPLLPQSSDVDAGLAGGDEQGRLGRIAEHGPLRRLVLRRHELGVVAQRDGLQQRRRRAASPAIDRRTRFAEHTPCGAYPTPRRRCSVRRAARAR